MSFQMPPAIRPFDPNHWLCGSSPLPRSDSYTGYQPVNEGPELDHKPTRRSVRICLLRSGAQHCMLTALCLACSQCNDVLCLLVLACNASFCWLPLTHCRIKAAQSHSPETLTQQCAFLQASWLLHPSLWGWLPFQEERQGRLSNLTVSSSCCCHRFWVLQSSSIMPAAQ